MCNNNNSTVVELYKLTYFGIQFDFLEEQTNVFIPSKNSFEITTLSCPFLNLAYARMYVSCVLFYKNIDFDVLKLLNKILT